MSLLREAHYALDAYFVYAAFTSGGYVKVGISRIPFERVHAIHANSPLPVEATIWAWVGSRYLARRIEKQLKKLWADRNTRGEWYEFDYENPQDKAEFMPVLDAVFEAVVGERAKWEKRSAEQVRELMQEINKKGFSKIAIQ